MKTNVDIPLHRAVLKNTASSQIISSTVSSTLVDKILGQIQQSIIRGELPQGSKINEQALAQKYGTSRGPTREAIQLLQKQRLVIKTPHVGARVAILSIDELNELYQLRSVLEGMACQLASQAMTKPLNHELQKLLNVKPSFFNTESLNTEYLNAGFLNINMASEQNKNNVDFHYQIIKASGNKHLQDILIGSLYYLIQMYRYQCQSCEPQTEKLEHLGILEAIIQGDGELASMLMQRHIERGRQKIALKLTELLHHSDPIRMK